MPQKTLGKTQRGSTQPLDFVYYGCKGGLNVLDPPQLIGDDDLTIAKDGYLQVTGDGLGGFRMRNGMAFVNTADAPASGMMILARFYQDVRSGVEVIPETLKLLGQVGGTLYDVTSSAYNPLGSIGANALPMTTIRIQNPNDPHFTGGLTDCIVICTGVGGPYVYDGTNLYTPIGWASANGAQWCAVVNGILWFGGIPAFPNQIFGAGDGITDSMETLPGYRNFAFSFPVMGLCALGSGANAALVIGLNTGISVLFGTGPSTFYRQDMPFEDGVTAGRSMIAAYGVVYFLGHNGAYAFDGMSAPKKISKKVEPWILADPFTPGYPMTNQRQLSWACVYNNRLHLGYCSVLSVPDTILCLDLDLGGWTVLLPAGGVASMCLLDAPTDPNPYQAVVGSSTSGKALHWDYVSSGQPTAAYDDAPNNTNPVLAQCQSKFFKLGVPGALKALLRFYPELFIAGPFVGNFVVNIDCGNVILNSLSNSDAYSGGVTGLWGSSIWGQFLWGGKTFTRFGPPWSRLDFNGAEGTEFAFGIQMTQPLTPWIYAGGSGTYHQRARV